MLCNGMSVDKPDTGRRRFLKTTATVGGLSLTGLAGCTSQLPGGGTPEPSGPLRIGVFGGIFKEMYTKSFFDPWEEETGNEIEAVPIGNVPAALKLKEQIEEGEPPVDVITQGPESLPKGLEADIYKPFTEDDVPRVSAVKDQLITRKDGQIVGAGVNAWFMAMALRTDKVDEPYPSSWKAWWDSRFEDRMEPTSVIEDAYFPWITAEVFFEGESMLSSEEGIDKVFEKMQGIKPQITKFYENEAQGQEDIRQGRSDIIQMWADIVAVMEGRQDNIERIIPEEGGVLDHGEWTVLRGTKRTQQALDFINFALQPEQQKAVASNLFMPPAVTDANLSSDIREKAFGGRDLDEHMDISYTYLFNNEEYMHNKWNKFIA